MLAPFCEAQRYGLLDGRRGRAAFGARPQGPESREEQDPRALQKRNNIVHGGESEEITADDVVWLRKTVHNLIRTIIKRRSEFESSEGNYTIPPGWRMEDRKLTDGTA